MEEGNNKRILALDVLRGITIAGMILVNDPGNNYAYAPLKHAQWIGLTPTDFVFPFFMFMMGISTYLSLRKYNFELNEKSACKIIKRTVVIFAIGLAITWVSLFCTTWTSLAKEHLPFASHLNQSLCNFSNLRIMGVLQRLALSYGIAAFVALTMKHKYIPWLIVSLFIAYFIILINGNGFANDHSNILYKVDDFIMGQKHMYVWETIDPEGFLGTIPCIAHVLIGFCVGKKLMQISDINKKVEFLFITGIILTVSGFLFSYGCPISKKIWTPSFSIVTCGMASSLLALLIWIIDIKGYKNWSRFFESFGVNPLFLYTLSEVLAPILYFIHIPLDNKNSIHAVFCNDVLQPVFGDYGASLAFAILYVVVNWYIGYILYKKKIYIKI